MTEDQALKDLKALGDQAIQSSIGAVKMLSKTSTIGAVDVTAAPSGNQNEIVSALIRIAQGIESLDKTLDDLADTIYHK